MRAILPDTRLSVCPLSEHTRSNHTAVSVFESDFPSRSVQNGGVDIVQLVLGFTDGTRPHCCQLPRSFGNDWLDVDVEVVVLQAFCHGQTLNIRNVKQFEHLFAPGFQTTIALDSSGAYVRFPDRSGAAPSDFLACDNIRVCPEELGNSLADALMARAFTTLGASRLRTGLGSAVLATSPAVAAATTVWQRSKLARTTTSLVNKC
jgi:hypothetical protein